MNPTNPREFIMRRCGDHSERYSRLEDFVHREWKSLFFNRLLNNATRWEALGRGIARHLRTLR